MKIFRSRRKRSLFGDAAIFGAMAVAARAFGLVKTVVMAGLIGPGAALDAWLLAFLAPSFVSDVFYAAFAPALVPRITDLRHHGKAEEAKAVYEHVLGAAAIAGGALSAAVAFCAYTLRNGFLAGSGEHVCDALLWIAPIFLLNACSNVWRSMLLAENRIAPAAAAPCLSPVIITVSLLKLTGFDPVSRLAIGTLTGSMAEAAIAASAVCAAGERVFLRRFSGSPFTSSFYKQYRLLVTGNIAGAGALMIDQAIASLAGEGGISDYAFGTRLPAALLAAGPAALSSAMLPWLAHTAARDGARQLRRQSMRVVAAAGSAAAVFSIPLAACSGAIIRLTMQHGAFNAAHTATVARVQAFSLLQLPFAVAVGALSRAIAATGDNSGMARTTICAALVTPVLDLALIRPLGVPGLALARTIILATTAVALGFIVVRVGETRIAVAAAAQ